MFGWYQNCFYLCTRFSEVKYSGCSAVRLAHLLWEQGVVGSNPATPTKKRGNYIIHVVASFFITFSGSILWLVQCIPYCIDGGLVLLIVLLSGIPAF